MDGCHFYNGVHLSAGLTNTPFALTGTANAVWGYSSQLAGSGRSSLASITACIVRIWRNCSTVSGADSASPEQSGAQNPSKPSR
jgi:hypothetical protein